jgi:hypothetical protein
MINGGDKMCRRGRARNSGLPAGDCPDFRVSENGAVPLNAAGPRVASTAVLRIAGLLALTIAGLCLTRTPATIAWWQSTNDGDDRQEYNIKLAYLCNFARYVTWPDDAADQEKEGVWIIGVLGKDPFREGLDRIAESGRKVHERKIVARHFASLDKYERCNVLFIPKTVPRKQQEAAIRALRGKPVLLVGEIPDFAALGGCLNFYLDEDNVRFEINLDSLRDHRIKASSKLLALAKIVKR